MLTDNEMASLQERFPEAWKELQRVRLAVEAHYKTACDLEFVIEHEKLHVVSVRPAETTARAALRIALDFYREGAVSENDLIDRLSLEQLSQTICDEIVDVAGLVFLARGLPTSTGAATGPVVLDVDRISHVFEKFERPVILLLNELYPDHLGRMTSGQVAGLVTMRGGVTSHAALVARSQKLPCVTGLSGTEIELDQLRLQTSKGHVEEGTLITIEGASGNVYAGEALINRKTIASAPEMRLLSQIIEGALIAGRLNDETMAKAWLMRDMMCHAWVPPSEGHADRLPRDLAFSVSTPAVPQHTLNSFWRQIDRHPEHLQQSLSLVYLGMLATLTRLVSERVGLGQHYQFLKPLWNPAQAVRKSRQLVGMDFFGISRFVPHLIDVATVRLVLEVRLRTAEDTWHLDATNPRGDSIIPGSHVLTGSALWVNDAKVELCDIPTFYNFFRRREYYWRWYEANNISRDDIIEFLRNGDFDHQRTSTIYPLAFRLGLIKHGKLTLSGKALIMNDENAQQACKTSPQSEHLKASEKRLQQIVLTVIHRGYEERRILSDDYSALIKRREFRDLIIAELYETYFPPSRHEFDYLLIKEAVEAVATNPVVAYVAGAISGGVVGNAAYDLLKHLAYVVSESFHGKDEPRSDIWRGLASDIERIELFFREHKRAHTTEIAEATGISRDKLIPLLKLLGFSFERAKGGMGWVRANAISSPCRRRTVNRK